MSKSRRIKALLVSAVLLGCAGAYCASIADGPDFDIAMIRNIPSKLSVGYLDQVIGSLNTWPSWFHAGNTIDEVDFRGLPYPKSTQKIETHGLLRLGMDTRTGMRDRFDITVLVLEYSPGKKIRMRVLSDSKKKLTALFDDIEWEIDLLPQTTGSLILGTVRAHTRQWRARLFGKLVPNIILNQIFYPNLFVLAEINNPSVVYPDPATQHGGM